MSGKMTGLKTRRPSPVLGAPIGPDRLEQPVSATACSKTKVERPTGFEQSERERRGRALKPEGKPLNPVSKLQRARADPPQHSNQVSNPLVSPKRELSLKPVRERERICPSALSKGEIVPLKTVR
jgi:hypothetical protein